MEFSAQEPTRETVWPIWVTEILHGIPCGVCNFPVYIVPPMGSRVSFINSRHPCGFLCGEFHSIQSRMGHHAENFSRCRLTWVPIVSYAFPWIPMQSHAETHMEIFNRINLATEGWRCDRNPRSQVN